MKILTRILFICLLNINFIFSEEKEEVRTMEKNGIIYKINDSSLHISLYDDNAILKASDEMKGADEIVSNVNGLKDNKPCDMNIEFSLGSMFNFGSDALDPGKSMSIKYNCPKKLNLFNNEFNQAVELSFSNLYNRSEKQLNFSGIYYVLNPSTNLLPFLTNLPVTFDLLGGITNVDSPVSKNSGIHLTLGAGVNYKLPTEKHDLSLGLEFMYTTGEISYVLYSVGLKYGKSLNFSK